jgi:hypothetical protein
MEADSADLSSMYKYFTRHLDQYTEEIGADGNSVTIQFSDGDVSFQRMREIINGIISYLISYRAMEVPQETVHVVCVSTESCDGH